MSNLSDYIEKFKGELVEIGMQSGVNHRGTITYVHHFAGLTNSIVRMRLENDPELPHIDILLSRIDSIRYGL